MWRFPSQLQTTSLGSRFALQVLISNLLFLSLTWNTWELKEMKVCAKRKYNYDRVQSATVAAGAADQTQTHHREISSHLENEPPLLAVSVTLPIFSCSFSVNLEGICGVLLIMTDQNAWEVERCKCFSSCSCQNFLKHIHLQESFFNPGWRNLDAKPVLRKKNIPHPQSAVLHPQ